MVARSRIGKFYVRRDRNGRFKKWTSVGRSLSADRRTKAKRKVKPGYGYRGDIKSRRSRKTRSGRSYNKLFS